MLFLCALMWPKCMFVTWIALYSSTRVCRNTALAANIIWKCNCGYLARNDTSMRINYSVLVTWYILFTGFPTLLLLSLKCYDMLCIFFWDNSKSFIMCRAKWGSSGVEQWFGGDLWDAWKGMLKSSIPPGSNVIERERKKSISHSPDDKSNA